jgi:hypothetical protein
VLEGSDGQLIVREAQSAEASMHFDYFHDASDDHLRMLGVDRALLPTREAWLASFEEQHARPLRARTNDTLVWEMEGQAVGFSSLDREGSSTG